ncbi:hypothetical protein OFL98_27995, partial [Escherichia coli]|nr:hypothetical protein [Escherichia coli]
MAGLKHYFERRLRVLKTGDLIAVPIDTQLGKALQESTIPGEDSAIDEVLGLIAATRPGQSLHYDDVAWFRVGHVQAMKQDSTEAVDG